MNVLIFIHLRKVKHLFLHWYATYKNKFDIVYYSQIVLHIFLNESNVYL